MGYESNISISRKRMSSFHIFFRGNCNYVLNRVRSAYSVQGLPVGSNNVGFDVIGASPEECYGYAGPVGKSGSETANDEESWWKKRHERMEELRKEQLMKNIWKIKGISKIS